MTNVTVESMGVHSGDRSAATLDVEHVSKRFGPTVALRDASLALRAGEIHGLMGENGAGKSTLVNILVGALRPDGGTIRLDGEKRNFASVRDAVEAGIIPIYQHLTLMSDLSVLENLFAFDIADGGAFLGLPRQATRERAQSMLEAVGLDINPQTLVSQLSLAQRQLVEIARGIGRDCRVLVLDEPTAALNRAEAYRLFDAMRRLCSAGTAVLFITHKIEEIGRIVDRVTVLRDGAAIIAGAARETLTGEMIVDAMIGRSLNAVRKTLPDAAAEMLVATALTGSGFRDVSMHLCEREIVGVVGLIGSGALEFGAALAGAAQARGALELSGSPVRLGDRISARAAGIGFVPADREQDGIFPGLSTLANATASVLDEVASHGWLAPHSELRRVESWIERLGVIPADPAVSIAHLSGGNQQKVLVLRNLAMDRLQVLVVLEPTRGVDVGARDEIHKALIEAASRGAGVVIVSSDLDEVLTLCHRIIVMRDGVAVAEFTGTCEGADVLGKMTGVA